MEVIWQWVGKGLLSGLGLVIVLLLKQNTFFLFKRILSKFHIIKNGMAKESYRLIDVGDHYSRIILDRSSVDYALGFVDIKNTTSTNEVILGRLAFSQTYSNALFLLGSDLLKKDLWWKDPLKSNGIDYEIINKRKTDLPDEIKHILHKKVKKYTKDYCIVESTINYNHKYRRRTLVFAKGIGIIYAKLEHSNPVTVEYTLTKFKVKAGNDYWLPINKKGNYWVYSINTCESEPNPINIK